ncbi:MAG TPA: hypothetical protein VF297_11220 [Pyrinomonadaceae bacterium]
MAVFFISILTIFERGFAAALACATVSVVLLLLGQTRPRRGR